MEFWQIMTLDKREDKLKTSDDPCKKITVETGRRPKKLTKTKKTLTAKISKMTR